MSSKLGYTLKQGGKQAFRNRAMTLTSTFAITAMLLILGMFFVIIINVNNAAEGIKDDYNNIELFVEETATVDQIEAIQKNVKEWKGVDSVSYRTKEQAMKILKDRWGENGYLLDSLGKNPLPNSIILKVTNLEGANEVAEKAKAVKGIESVKFYKDTVDTLLSATKTLQVAGIILMIFLVIVSVVVVSNTIKLTVFARSEEITIMKYVGATNWFIRGPFLAEGIIIGLSSAVIAAAILLIAYYNVAEAIGGDVMAVLSTALVPVKFLAINLGMIFASLGIAIGAWGSILSMRKFLDT